ncbi:hypothetical protein [Brevibacterium album]|uniref:hypothetical protein n=1 Tax=Brevibacterium album TaxID=417948 RepID=UPI00040D5B80|nr:hypothetical protein [Brevibacterium album]
MPHAHITVAQDRSAEVNIAGEVTPHPDLGSAVAHLAQHARSTRTDLEVRISDGPVERGLRISATGQIAAVPGEDTAAASTDEDATGSASAEGPNGAPHTAQAPPPGETGDAESRSEPEASAPAGAPEPTGLEQDPSDDASADKHSEEDSSAAADFPVGTRYSGPAETLGAAPDSGDGRRSERKRASSSRTHRVRRETPRRPRSVRLTVPSLVLSVLLVLALAFFFLPDLIGTPAADESGVPTDTAAPSRMPVTQEPSDTPVPGFAAEPRWEADVPPTASVTATSRGVLVVDSGRLTILDARTGTTRYSGGYTGSVTFAADTVIDGEPALVWRYDDRVQALFDGEDAPVDIPLGPEARMSAAGTGVLIREGNSLSTLGREGLQPVPTPAPGSTPMAVDDRHLISAVFEGPVVMTDIDTGETSEVPLERPGDNLEIKQWKSAGHGLAITVWGEPEAGLSSGHRLQLAVHSLEDGSLSSMNEVSSADIGEEDWTRGQGYALAVIGPFLYDIGTGLLLLDGTENGMQFGEPRGNLVPGTSAGEPIILAGVRTDADFQAGAPTAYTTGADLLAVTHDSRYAIVRSGADRVTAYPTG